MVLEYDHILIEEGTTFSDYHKGSIWTRDHSDYWGPRGVYVQQGAAFTVSSVYF